MIEIDKYQTELENGIIVYYAVKGKQKYKMPEAYKDMYNEHYLAIEEQTLEYPEIYGIEKTHYIPLRTD